MFIRGETLGTYSVPFTRENWKLQLEDQMVRAIPFGKLQKIWAVIRGDAIFLLVEVSLADVDIFYNIIPSPATSHLIVLCLCLKFPTGWFL